MSIYVESLIRADLEEVWRASQEPDRHQKWDLRFSRIEYLPKPSPEAPQRFLYATRIGLGAEIRGEGDSVGERRDDGSRTSALRFWSSDPRSLIREGAGYWKYVATPRGVRFLTRYDYDVRFGAAGRLIDRICFRPLLGWATAWSFDRLRLWLERGIDPTAAARQALIHAVARTAVALVWIYHGLVPKLLTRHASELSLLVDAGVTPERAGAVALAAGGVEVLFGGIVLATWPRRWPLALTVVLMAAALAVVVLRSPDALVAAFNPVSLNLSVIALSFVAWISAADLPLARRCRRRPPDETP